MARKSTGRSRGRPKSKPLTRRQKNQAESKLNREGLTGMRYVKDGKVYQINPRTGELEFIKNEK